MPLLPHLFPLSVPLGGGGGGMWGIFGKPLKRAIWNTPGLHAVLTICFRVSSVLDGACVACYLFLSTGRHHVGIQIHATCCCLPKCTTETFGSQKSTALGVQVSRRTSASPAKRPRTSGSQQPTCNHKEHQILTTAETSAFATQFWDRKEHPSKASQHEFLATCIDVDLKQKVKHAGRQKNTQKSALQTTYLVPYRGSRRQICKTQFLHYFKISRNVVQSVAKAKAAAAVASP